MRNLNFGFKRDYPRLYSTDNRSNTASRSVHTYRYKGYSWRHIMKTCNETNGRRNGIGIEGKSTVLDRYNLERMRSQLKH